MKVILLITCLLLLVGCSAGNGSDAANETPEPPDDQPTENLLSEIQNTIFTPLCTECHSGSSAPRGLSLESTSFSFQNLVGVNAAGNGNFKRVVPNDADNSFLVLKVAGDPVAGQRMPIGRPGLSRPQVDLIRSWINQGANPASSVNSISKVSRTEKMINSEGHKVLTIYFDAPIQVEKINNTSVLLYQKINSDYYVLSDSEYKTVAINDRTISVTIYTVLQKDQPVQLILNDPNSYPIVNQSGFLLDGNNNNQEGGRYEQVIQF